MDRIRLLDVRALLLTGNGLDYGLDRASSFTASQRALPKQTFIRGCSLVNGFTLGLVNQDGVNAIREQAEHPVPHDLRHYLIQPAH